MLLMPTENKRVFYFFDIFLSVSIDFFSEILLIAVSYLQLDRWLHKYSISVRNTDCSLRTNRLRMKLECFHLEPSGQFDRAILLSVIS